MTYLAFKPTLVPALLHFRSGRLGWYSRDTGGITAADTGIHFGLNALGLVTIFAKDIAKLDGWEQRIWAAHSTPLDGGASRELFDAQMTAIPLRRRRPRRRSLAFSMRSTRRSRAGSALPCFVIMARSRPLSDGRIGSGRWSKTGCSPSPRS